MNLYQNKVPVNEILSGASIAIAAILLIIPGFLTDTLGFLLIIPITRKYFISFISSKFKKKTNKNENVIEGSIYDEENKDNDRDV